MQMLGFNFRGRGWLRLELFGGAVFWCGGVFCRLWGDSIEKGEEKPLQSFTEEKNPQAMGMVESSGARPAPQGVRNGRSKLHLTSREKMCPLLLLQKTRMA